MPFAKITIPLTEEMRVKGRKGQIARAKVNMMLHDFLAGNNVSAVYQRDKDFKINIDPSHRMICPAIEALLCRFDEFLKNSLDAKSPELTIEVNIDEKCNQTTVTIIDKGTGLPMINRELINYDPIKAIISHSEKTTDNEHLGGAHLGLAQIALYLSIWNCNLIIANIFPDSLLFKSTPNQNPQPSGLQIKFSSKNNITNACKYSEYESDMEAFYKSLNGILQGNRTFKQNMTQAESMDKIALTKSLEARKKREEINQITKEIHHLQKNSTMLEPLDSLIMINQKRIELKGKQIESLLSQAQKLEEETTSLNNQSLEIIKKYNGIKQKISDELQKHINHLRFPSMQVNTNEPVTPISEEFKGGFFTSPTIAPSPLQQRRGSKLKLSEWEDTTDIPQKQ